MSKLLIVVKEMQVLRVLAVMCALTVTVTCHAQAFSSSVPDGGSSAGVLTLAESKTSSLPDAPTAQSVSLPSPRSTGAASHGLSSQAYVFPTFEERKKHYIYDLIGPGAFIGAAVQSTIDQTHPLKVGYPSDGFPGIGQHPAHGSVPEWGEGGAGFSKRYASRFGMGLIGTTTRYGLGELLHQDVSYQRCTCTGIMPRTYHAVTQSFIAHTASGRAVPSLPALVSPFIAAEVGTVAWYPNRYNTSDALRTSTTLYYSIPIKNVIREFSGR
jgi:hypothetical protein